jgi:hypothetical protein
MLSASAHGLKYDEVDTKRWVIDEEGAALSAYLYDASGRNHTNDIARILKREKVLTPSAYAFQKGYRKPSKKVTRGESFWDTPIVRQILQNRSYVGDVINFKTYSKSYKLKARWKTRRRIGKSMKMLMSRLSSALHGKQCKRPLARPSTASRSMWKSICWQVFEMLRLRGQPSTTNTPMIILITITSPAGTSAPITAFCAKTHHIRVDTITEIITRQLSDILRFASMFEDEFVKIVVDEHYKLIQMQQRKNQTALQAALMREKELDILFDSIYEDKALGGLSEERYQKMAYKYEDAQSAVKQHIKHLKEIVAEEKTHEMNADGFMALVKKYTDVENLTLTPEILHECIDNVVVHHREQVGKNTEQSVEIYFKMIGQVQIPRMKVEEREMYLKSFGRMKKTG